ncbi:hypothetical protein SLA2020_443490 [Shorea laevis]
MKSLNIFIATLILIMALAISLSVASHDQEDANETALDLPFTNIGLASNSLRGAGRFLAQNTRLAAMTCNEYPRVCRAKGSPGPDCCKKKCVKVTTDRLNCGKCGRKCKYSEICCKGQCMNPMTDHKHCGDCNNKCGKGNKCVHGMCNYA